MNSIFPFTLPSLLSISALVQAVEKSETSLTTLFLTCLKIGAVWFGGGYILVAYFDGEFVQGLHWLTRQELLDAIAVGQFTPGPFLSSATFIGYQIAGLSGAIVATIGIVIPAFIFVALLNPLIPKLRQSQIFSKFLDSVNISALAVMLVVSIQLGIELMYNPADGIEWQSLIIAVMSAVVFFIVKKINAAYIILGGALLGYLFTFF
jgi:chromate transporter